MAISPKVFIGKSELRIEVYNYEGTYFRVKIFIPKRAVNEDGIVDVRGKLFKIHLKIKEDFKKEIVLEMEGNFKVGADGNVRIRDAAKFQVKNDICDGMVILYAKCYIPYKVRREVQDKKAES